MKFKAPVSSGAFLFRGRVENVRFGSEATDTFHASSEECPLLLDSDQIADEAGCRL